MSDIILLAEDDEELRTIYRRALAQGNYTLLEADSGDRVIELLQTNTPALLVLDMLMPEVPGDRILQQIQTMPHLKHMHVIVITALPGYRESAIDFEVDQFLLKPVSPHDLRQAVELLLAP